MEIGYVACWHTVGPQCQPLILTSAFWRLSCGPGPQLQNPQLRVATLVVRVPQPKVQWQSWWLGRGVECRPPQEVSFANVS